MTTSEQAVQEPLWLSIEENLLKLNPQDLTGKGPEAAIQKIAADLDAAGYNVSKDGGNMLQLRWAMDAMLKVGRPLMKDMNEAISALTLENLVNPRAATAELIHNLGKEWNAIKIADRKPELLSIIEKAKLDLLVDKAKSLSGDEGVRFLIGEEVASDVIVRLLEITEADYDRVNAEVEKEKAEKARVATLLEKVEGASDEEKVTHLINNDVSEELIMEMAGVDQSVVDGVKRAMEEELKEKQRLAEEEAARKKAEAEGPALEDIPPDQLLEYIEGLREILDFSDVEKDIRIMSDQSSIPKSLVDIAVSDPDRLDELEKEAEG
jgi:hypothetical protein